jgi:ribosomal protein L11 methyltransferase
VDIDPQALTAARTNAVRNGITGNFDVLLPEALPACPVDLVLANILANPLVELADELAGRVCVGGRIVLTGILDEQAGEVMKAYQPRFVFTEPVRRDGWVRLDGTCL